MSRKPDADNLVFGAPREGGHRSTFKRSAWAGLSDAPARFAALLLGKAGRMQAALAAGELAESQPPGISERYFAAPPARQRLQAWGVTARMSGLRCEHECLLLGFNVSLIRSWSCLVCGT